LIISRVSAWSVDSSVLLVLNLTLLASADLFFMRFGALDFVTLVREMFQGERGEIDQSPHRHLGARLRFGSN